jgi:hypothetical protein
VPTVPKNPRPPRARRALSVVGDDPLPDVRVVDIGTVPMTDEQYTAAVHALAALIDTWRSTQACLLASPAEDPDLPQAA